MSQFLRDYLTVAIFAGVAVGLLAVVLSVGKLFRPVKPDGDKYLTYESGVDPVGDGWAQSPIRYYVFALLFVMFDVEAVFVFPWAVNLDDTKVAGMGTLPGLGWFGFVEMTIFVVILTLGLVYAWRKGVLRWV